jgi:hypothetical protein
MLHDSMKARIQGFTRLELLFVALGVAIVALPAVSLLASNKSESQRVVCFNNLRQIGRGFLAWSSDHGERFPFPIDWQNGGTRGHPLAGNLWFQFAWVSNHIASPKVLACPADQSNSAIADTWDYKPGGLPYPGYQNGALSYFMGLHAQPYNGQLILSGDRNIRASAYNSGCGFLAAPLATVLFPDDTSIGWTNAIHGTAGHLLLSDGSVSFANSVELQRACRQGNNDNGETVHLLSR